MGLFSFNKTKNESTVNWIALTEEKQIAEAIENSSSKPVLFFKHSTRCSISSMALNRFENEWNNENNCTIYYLDLIQYRALSNALADTLNVQHQSPQAILVNNKLVTYHASHSSIDVTAIKDRL
ncbi:MAG: bacillithiol system redox-active protein YtxJ [Lishizhenia sp.]